MELKDQVCTLQQAVKLKELGVIQNGNYVYRHWRGNGKVIISKFSERYHDYPKHRRQVCANVLGCAFTVAELLDILPSVYLQNEECYTVRYDSKHLGCIYSDTTAAKACAEALIDLIKKGIATV